MIGRQLWLLLTRRDWRGDASAYLDDELTPRQRKQYVARLARSGEMQEYLDDLRQMRTALRGFAAESARAPFQITPEMLASQTAAPLRTTRVERALRLSMATAAVGVATFTAVLIFDAVDRPTVTFTTTSAGDTRADAPAAQVAVERATAQESAAGGSAVAVASIASSASQQGQQTVAPAREAETTEPAEQATVSAYNAEQDSEAEQEQAAVQEQAQAQAQRQAAQESEWQQSAQEQAESAQAAAHQQAAADPTRRALTAGSANGEANEQEVSAADVVATQEEQSAQAAVAAVTAQEEEESPAIDSADASEGQESAESADTDESGDDTAETADGQAAADAGTASQTATVTSSVRVVDSEWPLPQRPQSSSVQLASDPSWEAPLQIALAVVAFGSLLAWVVLTVMDRRRQT